MDAGLQHESFNAWKRSMPAGAKRVSTSAHKPKVAIPDGLADGIGEGDCDASGDPVAGKGMTI